MARASNKRSRRSACCKRVCAISKPPDLSSLKRSSVCILTAYSRRRARAAGWLEMRANTSGGCFSSLGVQVTDKFVSSFRPWVNQTCWY